MAEVKAPNRRSFFPEGAFNVKVAASDPSNKNSSCNPMEDHDDVVVGNSSDEATPVLEVMISKNTSNFKQPPPPPPPPQAFPFPSKWDDAEKWLSTTTKSKPAAAAAKSSSKKKFFGNSSHASSKNHAFRTLQVHRDREDDGAEDDDCEEETTKKIDPSSGGSMVRFSFPMMASAMSKQSQVSRSCEGEFRGGGDGRRGERPPSSSSSLDCFQRITLEDPDYGDSPCFDFKQEAPLDDRHHHAKSPTSIHESVACIADGLGTRSIAMRDMGTEMTPIASTEPSRTGTPTMRTPTLRSPGLSPAKIRPIPPPPVTAPPTAPSNVVRAVTAQGSVPTVEDVRQCVVLAQGQAQGNMPSLEDVRRSVVESRAAAWEDAEQAKYTARYEREEAKIIAWENHEKAKAEAELRKMEVKVERMRSNAHERLMNKMAATRRRAEERRLAAEAKRRDKETEAAVRADGIRRTGRTPAPSTCGNLLRCCLTSNV